MFATKDKSLNRDVRLTVKHAKHSPIIMFSNLKRAGIMKGGNSSVVTNPGN